MNGVGQSNETMPHDSLTYSDDQEKEWAPFYEFKNIKGNICTVAAAGLLSNSICVLEEINKQPVPPYLYANVC